MSDRLVAEEYVKSLLEIARKSAFYEAEWLYLNQYIS